MNVSDLERHGPWTAAVAAAASHATALGGGYVWLDHAHLEEGLAVAPPSEWPSLFTRGFAGTGYYRPLTALSLSLDEAVSGSSGLFHATTLGWHAAAAGTVVLAGRALGFSPRAALVAGVLFGVHPATSLVASAIAFRSEAMIVVALMLLIVAHLSGRAVLAALALLAGALTKETAWVLGPCFVVALEVHRRSTTSALDEAASRRLLSFEALAFVTATALRVANAPHFRAGYGGLPWPEAVGSRLAALAKTAFVAIAPIDRSLCDAFPLTPLTHPLAILGGAVVAFVAWVASRRGVAGWLLALCLLPSLQLVPVMRWWSPHYLYVPLVFVTLLGAQALLDHGRFTRWLPALLVVFAGLSWLEGRRYESDSTLWTPEVAAEPSCREGHFFLGESARIAHHYTLAAAHYERAATKVDDVLSYADELAALQNLGAMRLEQGRLPEASAAWTAALERAVDPVVRRRLVHNLATLAFRNADFAEAARLLESEAQAAHPLPESLVVLARALHELGRDTEAVALLGRLRAPTGD